MYIQYFCNLLCWFWCIFFKEVYNSFEGGRQWGKQTQRNTPSLLTLSSTIHQVVLRLKLTTTEYTVYILSWLAEKIWMAGTRTGHRLWTGKKMMEPRTPNTSSFSEHLIFNQKTLPYCISSYLAWSHIRHFKFIFVNASAKTAVKLFNSSTQSTLGKQTHCAQSVNSFKKRYSRPYSHEQDQRCDRNPQVLDPLKNVAQAPRYIRTSPILTFLSE